MRPISLIVSLEKTSRKRCKLPEKGSLAGVDGRLQTRNYENQQGQRVFVTEVQAESVQFLEPKTEAVLVQVDTTKEIAAEASTLAEAKMIIHSGNQNNQRRNQGNSFNDDPFANDGKPIDISDDDLPF